MEDKKIAMIIRGYIIHGPHIYLFVCRMNDDLQGIFALMQVPATSIVKSLDEYLTSLSINNKAS